MTGYTGTFENYTTQAKANNAYNQKADAAYEFTGSKTKARIYDSYVNTHDPQFNPNGTVINGALVTREARWNNVLCASAEYFLGDKFSASVDADTSRNKYLSPALQPLLNTSIVTFGAKGAYRIAPKTRTFVALHRRLVHYTEGSRQDNHQDWLADVGIEGDLTAKIKGLVQTGLIYQDFDKDSTNPTRKNVARQT